MSRKRNFTCILQLHLESRCWASGRDLLNRPTIPRTPCFLPVMHWEALTQRFWPRLWIRSSSRTGGLHPTKGIRRAILLLMDSGGSGSLILSFPIAKAQTLCPDYVILRSAHQEGSVSTLSGGYVDIGTLWRVCIQRCTFEIFQPIQYSPERRGDMGSLGRRPPPYHKEIHHWYSGSRNLNVKIRFLTDINCQAAASENRTVSIIVTGHHTSWI